MPQERRGGERVREDCGPPMLSGWITQGRGGLEREQSREGEAWHPLNYIK